jgi:nucleoside-diphosphate-sugar epimerase
MVWATTRNASKAALLGSQGIQPLIADWTDKSTLEDLPAVDQILVAVSYDRSSCHSRYDSQVGGLRNLLQSISPTANLCYISTTGVYHQTDGSWVDETSPTDPTRESGRAHLQAEEMLNQLRPDSAWTILRLAGIYGPGRIPRAADVIAGRPITSAATGFLNLIHVDDAVDAVFASWSRSKRRLYAVSDDQPIVRGEFYQQIARQCGAPPASFIEPPPDAAPRMRSESNKRISNRRMKRDLVTKLNYPTYREGLASLL